MRPRITGLALLALTLFLFVKNTEQKCRCNYRTVFASGRVLISDTIDLSRSKDVMSLFREFQLCDRSRFCCGQSLDYSCTSGGGVVVEPRVDIVLL